MEKFIDQILNILTSPPGNLAYHLVLIFSISMTLQAGFALSRSIPSDQFKRVLSGAFLLLAFQVTGFITTALAWQGVTNASLYVPAVDRSMITLSFLWIIWAWIFTKPSRAADVITIILSFAMLALLAFSITAWNTQQPSTTFNSTLLDWGWSILTTILLICGILLVLVYKPKAWGLALLFLNINLLGAMAHMLWAYPNSDYSALVRIAQLCSFPFLPAMVFYQVTKTRPAIKSEPSERLLSAALADEWFDIVSRENRGDFLLDVTKYLATNLNACCCVWLNSHDNSFIHVRGYSLVKQQFIPESKFNPSNLRAINKALTKPQLTIIEKNLLTKDEFSTLSRAIPELDNIEQIIISPVFQGGKNCGAFLVANSETDEERTRQADLLLKEIQKWVKQYLERAELLYTFAAKNEALTRELSAAHHQLNRQSAEIVDLRQQSAEADSATARHTFQAANGEQIETPPGENTVANAPISSDKFAEELPVSAISSDLSLTQLFDEIIDKVSLQLFERNLILKMDISEDIFSIRLSEYQHETLNRVLPILFRYASDKSIENGVVLFTAYRTLEIAPSLLILIQTTPAPEGIRRIPREVNTANPLTEIIKELSGFHIDEILDGNFYSSKLVIHL